MILKLVALTLVILVAVLAYLAYTPMHEDIEDRFGAMIGMAVFNFIVKYPANIRAFFQGTRLENNFALLTMPLGTEKDSVPVTSWFCGLNVSRTTIEGCHAIVYRHLDEQTSGLRPGLIFFHGGGWITGSADFADLNMHEFALCTGTVIINVDYRLAPEHPFPAAFEDAVAVTRHILRHGEKFGMDVNRIGVAGDSAGANLATAAALHLVKNGKDLPRLKFQALINPALQAMDFQTPSHIDNNDTYPIITSRNFAIGTSLYFGLGNQNGGFHGRIFHENRHISPEFRSKYDKYLNVSNLPKKYRSPRRRAPTVTEPYNKAVFERIKDILVDPRFSPLMADDLSGLPDTIVTVNKFDVLRDDGLLYAKRLRDAGVRTKVHDGNGFHVDYVIVLPDFLRSKTGKKAVKDMCDFVSDAVGTDSKDTI